ncbi:toxic anion resistance protein [Nocardia sp. NRRL S-836]|uniref:toxic anion resistance protein n=1 Tax=Nocardia sp. NRRL S-836 TaxID=1519492 RepID=UPI0006AFA50D|nr:toxic anion resistance protein [Nocardia sp. NRRL S-836]KOV80864.1 toxic anion resistance protein [Nocardia sp. NRRL S-836]
MSDFVLTPPDPVEPVPVERAAGLIPVPDDARTELSTRAQAFVDALGAVDPRSPDFGRIVDEALVLGEAEMRVAAQIAGRLLDRTLASVSSPNTTQVTASLTELRRSVRELDPQDLSKLTGRKVLGFLPGGNAAKGLLARLRAADEPVNRIVLRLRSGQDALKRDNAAIKGERQRLWDLMTRLSQDAALAGEMDAAVDRQVQIFDLSDPGRADALRADVLFGLRQRHQDLLTQLAVCAQGYLALDVVRRNNDELVKGIERAVTTTVTALRIGVAVAAALAGQREVIDQVDAVRGLTDEVLKSNATLMSLQSHDVQRIAATPAVGIDAVRTSFDQIYAAIDAIDTFKARAADSMSSTVHALDAEIRRAHDHLSRVRGAEEPA